MMVRPPLLLDYDLDESEHQDDYNHLLFGERLEKVQPEGGVAIVRRTLGEGGELIIQTGGRREIL